MQSYEVFVSFIEKYVGSFILRTKGARHKEG